MTDTETIFRKQMAAYGDCDVEHLLETFADDCVLTDMADPDRPSIGKPAVRAFLEDYFAPLSNVDVTITSVAAAGELVMGELDVDATYTEAGVVRTIRLRYCVVERIRGGHVVDERFYWDSEELKLQLTSV